ncbi:MAG: hypothetical protein ACYTEQ_21130 [Planctomycetota bacterium]|jgi:hypothetical protein
MAFAWKEYLDVANLLLGQEVEAGLEAAKRSAVSRAYYAAYGHTKKHVTDRKGYEQTEYSDHSRLRRFCQNHRMNSVARNLEQLCMWRENCDYDDDVPGLENMISNAINIAEKVIQTLRD